MMTISLGKRLADLNGVGPGFDHLRIGLAIGILTWHSFSISYGQAYAASLPRFPVPVMLAALLPMFFGLSGFLVMGSALRVGNLKTFITLRVLRILPALFTEIMISALILGPLLTSYTLSAYFRSPMFFEYFGSLIGRVRFSLPGLFLDNPAPELVNFALWTVGPEILCYVIMAILLLTGLFRSRSAMIALTGAYVILGLVVNWVFPPTGIVDVLPPQTLIYAFLCGNLIYLYKNMIPYNLPFGVIALIAGLSLIYLVQAGDAQLFTYLALPCLIYGVAVAGLTSLPRMPLFHRGDYSYGLYIYGFPIQQAIAHFLPNHREWFVNLALAFPITLTFAVASWHLIEKPVLNLRKRLKSDAGPELQSRKGTIRKVILFSGLAAYGLFVADASNVLPLRPGAKMALFGFGLYTYQPKDRRPWATEDNAPTPVPRRGI